MTWGFQNLFKRLVGIFMGRTLKDFDVFKLIFPFKEAILGWEWQVWLKQKQLYPNQCWRSLSHFLSSHQGSHYSVAREGVGGKVRICWLLAGQCSAAGSYIINDLWKAVSHWGQRLEMILSRKSGYYHIFKNVFEIQRYVCMCTYMCVEEVGEAREAGK